MFWACRRHAEPETLKIDTSVLLVSLIMRRFQPGSPPGFFLSSEISPALAFRPVPESAPGKRSPSSPTLIHPLPALRRAEAAAGCERLRRDHAMRRGGLGGGMQSFVHDRADTAWIVFPVARIDEVTVVAVDMGRIVGGARREHEQRLAQVAAAGLTRARWLLKIYTFAAHSRAHRPGPRDERGRFASDPAPAGTRPIKQHRCPTP